MTTPIYNPPMPYVGPVPSPGMVVGRMIRIHGQVNPYPKCFAINLQLGPSVNPRADIALHLSPVFNPPPRVVRNSLACLEWGAEESHGGFPFTPGQPFEVIILVKHDSYKIAINGYHFTEFKHRMSPSHVSHLAIDGDVTIQGIIFEMNTSSAPSSSQGLPPYPQGASAGMPPYPVASGSVPYPPQPGPSTSYPTAGPPPAYPPQAGYVPQASYPSTYPQPAAYPAAYPQQPYPVSYQNPNPYVGYPTQHNPNLADMGAGVFGRKPHKSGITPGGVAGIAAGVGAAAIGASMLSHAVPKLKMKKVFKGPKFLKHKGWGHKGWGHKGWGHKGWGKKSGFGFGKFKHKGWCGYDSD